MTMDPRGRERLATVLPCMTQDDQHEPHFYDDPDDSDKLYWCSGLGRPEVEDD